MIGGLSNSSAVPPGLNGFFSEPGNELPGYFRYVPSGLPCSTVDGIFKSYVPSLEKGRA